MKKKRWGDVILIAVLLSVALVLFSLFIWNQDSGAGVIVAVDGKEIARYALDADGTYVLNGGTNTLVIENGKAFLSEADCPDHLCVKQGKINGAGQVITCLPNRLTVTVYGQNGDVELIS